MAKAKPQITTKTSVKYEIDPRGGILEWDSRPYAAERGQVDEPWMFALVKVTTTSARDGRGTRYSDRDEVREVIDILSADQVATLVRSAVEQLTWPANTANRNLLHDTPPGERLTHTRGVPELSPGG